MSFKCPAVSLTHVPNGVNHRLRWTVSKVFPFGFTQVIIQWRQKIQYCTEIAVFCCSIQEFFKDISILHAIVTYMYVTQKLELLVLSNYNCNIRMPYYLIIIIYIFLATVFRMNCINLASHSQNTSSCSNRSTTNLKHWHFSPSWQPLHG